MKHTVTVFFDGKYRRTAAKFMNVTRVESWKMWSDPNDDKMGHWVYGGDYLIGFIGAEQNWEMKQQ